MLRLNALTLLQCQSRKSITNMRNPSRVFQLRIRQCTTNNTNKKTSPKNEFKFTWKSFAVGALACVATGAYFEHQKREKLEEIATNVKSYGKPSLGGPYVMFNQDGVPVTDATYHGQFVLLYFGFTFCPDICPNELVKMGKVIDALDKKKLAPLAPVFISLDPARDTLGQLKNYGQDFHKKFHWLTGTKEQISSVTRAFRVYFSKVDENDDNEEDYLVDHSIVMYLMSPTGEFLDFYTQRATVPDIVSSIEQYMKDKK
eukprot:CAMPEP_0114429468 /NCGR_PEP_ID=MMETSP0103-20121206/9506_1 /TAXON_ID=37642 ORGANISM="Paraphysomonas imperforata, Strain PA2" /NCGR_SAMPLE_ID=MMETSP0103 /ASSEMBLY_ACC=CAM_ASM_000201 /LENGTH=257 /DNA_ID=CAMNT_0001598815 /DNA_START=118 /DNA_END=891 /DNA_ORIENTATION=-